MIWLAAATALAWAVLMLGRGMFWRGDVTDAADQPGPAAWPPITILVPARDEAPTIAAVTRALLAQDYPGELTLWVVDDRSRDGTGELARAVGDARLTVITGQPQPVGWTGKLWALQQGLEAARPATPYLLFTDADIIHAPDSLRRLVARAEAGGFALTSLMAKLRCESAAERFFIPAFIYFFQMLYPFAWVNDPHARTAGAAGGCVLLRRECFEAAGGLAAIRGAMIDDCTLAALIKRHGGGLWLGLTDRVVSLRACDSVAPIRAMVARTAYAQLCYSPALLVGMLAALALVFLAPPLLLLFAEGPAWWLGAAAWGAMTLSFVPIQRFYGLSSWRALALPAVALAYMLYTLDSARKHHLGCGGMWKGEAGPPPM